MVTNPKISIVTVCYNAVDTIETTILSIINQGYANKEFVVIDGGSNDGTLDIINKYSDSIDFILSEPDHGIYDAMNKGIKASSGRWINFMNSGDVFYDNHVLSKTFANRDIHEEVEVVYGDVCLKRGEALEDFKAVKLSLFYKCMPFCHQSCFVRSDIISPFDTKFKLAADYNFFYHLYYSKGEKAFLYVPITISVYESAEGVSYRQLSTLMREFLYIRREHITSHWFYTWFVYFYRYKLLPKFNFFNAKS